jgi:zinc protease
VDDRPHPEAPRVVIVDRPDSPQSELRVGHVGLPRRVPEFHAVSVLSSILGGLFNSRLQRLLREQRGYTYGVHAGFDLRRGAGPFAVRTAVETDATVPAIRDILAELERIRSAPVDDGELAEARDYLVGVFPLRFEAAPQVVAAITSLVTHELPDDELDRYRPSIAAVDAASVLDAARRHIRPSEASIVVIGDARRFEAELRDADVGPLSIVAERETAAPTG